MLDVLFNIFHFLSWLQMCIYIILDGTSKIFCSMHIVKDASVKSKKLKKKKPTASSKLILNKQVATHWKLMWVDVTLI